MNNETKVNIDGKKFLIKLKDAERLDDLIYILYKKVLVVKIYINKAISWLKIYYVI